MVDLGSGAGFDVFLAARKVGETGMAIGVDMSKVGYLISDLSCSKPFCPLTAKEMGWTRYCVYLRHVEFATVVPVAALAPCLGYHRGGSIAPSRKSRLRILDFHVFFFQS